MIQNQGRHKQAFTLIELSIVLVIIGLIVGGVLVGRDLMESAKLNKVQAEFVRHSTAINTFRIKYNCLPGDCVNASTYLTGATNGNGNSRIENGITSSNEEFYFWQHLASAGLAAGSFSGNDNGGYLTAGINVPPSAIKSDAFYRVYYHGTVTDPYDHYYKPANYDHVVYIASQCWDFQWCFNSPFSGEQALHIDRKFDDGTAYYGRINGTSCAADPAYSTDSSYITTAGTYCPLTYLLGF